jgi:hypothetical protein
MSTPKQTEWDQCFYRDSARRIMRQTERLICDAIGNPLRDETVSGTFSNGPGDQPRVNDLIQTMRRIAYSPELDRPKRIEFGAVSVAAFWTSIQNIEFNELPKTADEFGFPVERGELVITALLPDRDTGKQIGITFTFGVPLAAWNHEPSRPKILRAAILQWLTHEIDEHIFVDGLRVSDPHAGPGIAHSTPDEVMRYFAGSGGMRP